MKRTTFIIVTGLGTLGLLCAARAAELSIYEIQYTVDVNGVSPQHGNIVDCRGGVVTHKRGGGRPRLIVQDPNFTHGWSAVQVKGWSRGIFDHVTVGDWVKLKNVMVEDFAGTTFLQYKQYEGRPAPELTIASAGNSLPRPVVVEAGEIAAPTEGVDEWVVTGLDAEKYEAMLMEVVDVTVSDTGYGKAFDNYILASNVDPNHICWVSDYMNGDVDEIYHPLVQVGQEFCGVVGILEQYVGQSEGIYYDYYQLLTRGTEDFTMYRIADLDFDCDVDFDDFDRFARYWLDEGCHDAESCGGADLIEGPVAGAVDALDLHEFAERWLEGKRSDK
ncbi:MAG: hypothetical protein JSU70_14395 [Phycisphaerales bacterium]|nr:MAG: hypothetical protein JSU70_14395 [Phycisphaerales bacterium]